MFLDSFDYLFVNSLLIGLALLRRFVFFLFGFENITFLVISLFGCSAEIIIITLSGTLTPDTSTLVLVANKYIWLTRRNGQPLHFMGPVIKRRPLASCLRTITRFPLWTPAKRMATAPGARLDLNDLLCLEKKFFDVPLGSH